MLLLAFFCSAAVFAQPRIATVVYQDGTSVTLKDWSFQYQFGEADEIARNQIGYTPTVQSSDDLILEDGILRRTELKSIRLFWGESAGWSLRRTEIVCRNGKTIRKSLLMPKSALISTKKHVFQEKVALVDSDGVVFPLNWMTVAALDKPGTRISAVIFSDPE